MIKIRQAEEVDLPEIMELYALLFAYSATLQPDYFQAAGQQYDFLQRCLQDTQMSLLLAVQEREIAGMALVQIQQTPPYTCLVPHRFAYLMDLIVRPEQRNQGVATALLDAVKQWGAANKLDYVELQVLAGNDKAERLYLKQGFQPKMKTLCCPLSSEV